MSDFKRIHASTFKGLLKTVVEETLETMDDDSQKIIEELSTLLEDSDDRVNVNLFEYLEKKNVHDNTNKYFVENYYNLAKYFYNAIYQTELEKENDIV